MIERTIGFTPERFSREADLEAADIHLPLTQRAAWQRLRGARDGVLVAWRDAAGRLVNAAAADISPSRALPGHRIYRVVRFAPVLAESDAAILRALADDARRDPRCLRLVVELFTRDEPRRRELERELAALGFHRAHTARMYARTSSIELDAPADVVFSRISSSARRNVRQPAKRGLIVRPVTDPGLSPRMNALLEGSFRRHGGRAERTPWADVIALSAQRPDLSRICGVFDPSLPPDEQLVAFAWGCMHGDYVTYEAGAALRRSGGALSYAPLWDLVRWAAEDTRARWFDLGGIASGKEGDAREGISEFKRYFSETYLTVGAEWWLEPRPVRATMGRVIQRAARWAAASLRALAPRADGAGE